MFLTPSNVTLLVHLFLLTPPLSSLTVAARAARERLNPDQLKAAEDAEKLYRDTMAKFRNSTLSLCTLPLSISSLSRTVSFSLSSPIVLR